MSKYDIFISHKSQDKESLTKVEAFLESQGLSYWSDTKMQSGFDWTRQIERAIADSRIMLVLLSQHVIDDPDNMESEIVSAIEKRLKFVVIKLDDSDVADYEGVFSLYLKKVQWINANNNVVQTFESLSYALKMNLASKSQDKEELNEQMQQELKRLAKKQKEEYEKEIQNRVMEGIMEINISKIRTLMNDKLYQRALKEVNNLLLTSNTWRVHELKLRCITRDYTDLDTDYQDELDEIQELGCPYDEFEKIQQNLEDAVENNRIRIQEEKEKKEVEETKKRLNELNSIKIESEKEQHLLTLLVRKKNVRKVFSLIKYVLSLVVIFAFSFIALGKLPGMLFVFIILTIGITKCYLKSGFLRFLLLCCFVGTGFFFLPDLIKFIDTNETKILAWTNDIILFANDNFEIDLQYLIENIAYIQISIVLTIIIMVYMVLNHISVRSKRSGLFSLFSVVFSLISAVIFSALLGLIFFGFYRYIFETNYMQLSFAITLFIAVLISRNFRSMSRIRRETLDLNTAIKQSKNELSHIRRKAGDLRA